MIVLDPSALAALLRHPEIASAIRDAVGSASADIWLTLEQAAEIAGVAPRVLRDAGRTGKLVLGSASGEPRCTRRELDRWLSTAPRTKPRKVRTPRADFSSEPANDTTDARAAARAAVARAAAKISKS